MNRFQIAIALLKKSLKKIIIFEAIYTLLKTAIFTPILVEMVNLALQLAGVKYLTNSRLPDFVLKPTTIAIILLALVMIAVFSLIEIASLIYCFDIEYHKHEVRVMDMIKQGAKSALSLINNNFIMIVFMLLIIPINNIAFIVLYLFTKGIPVFAIEFIQTNKNVVVLALMVFTVLCIYAVRRINCLQYFTIEKYNYKISCNTSLNLNKHKFFQVIFCFIIWQMIAMSLIIGSYVIVTFIVTNTLKMFLKHKMAYNISLFLSEKMYLIFKSLYLSMMTPITFSFLSANYYFRKKKINESIKDPVIHQHKRATRTKFKKIISVIVLASAVLNIIYIKSDFGIFRGSAKVQFLTRTKIAAHRGDSKEAPENTLAAFESAISNLADYAELDVQETKDGKVVVMHDSNLKRVSGVKKNIWNVGYKDLMNLDVGSWFSNDFREEKIPTLEEVIEFTKGKLKLNIEIKLTGHEKHLEESVVELIEKYGIENDCVVTSFQSKALQNVKKYNQDIKTGYILHVAYGDFSGLEYANALSVNYTFATAKLVNEAHSADKEVYVWTVNSPEAITEMVEKGVDMIITDDPVLARETITSYETNPIIVKLVKYFCD